jgi:hypothetical protein
MNARIASHLTFDSPAMYEIRVLGRLTAVWSDRLEGMSIRAAPQPDEPVVTVLTGALLDQAALAGVMTTLYELHLPVLSVQCLNAE